MRSKYSTQDKNLAAIQESIKSMMHTTFGRIVGGQDGVVESDTNYSVSPDRVVGVLKIRADLYTLQSGDHPLVEETNHNFLDFLQGQFRNEILDDAEGEFRSGGFEAVLNSSDYSVQNIADSVEEDYDLPGIGPLGQYSGAKFPELLKLLRTVSIASSSEVFGDFYDYFDNVMMAQSDIYHTVTITVDLIPVGSYGAKAALNASLSFVGSKVPPKFKKPVSLTRAAGIPREVEISSTKTGKLHKYFHAIADLFV
jgi:hypothetical protein